MKKIILSVLLFTAVFCVVYLALCYLVPGLRIKLEAPPMVYFIESITHMVLFKAILSAAAGCAAVLISEMASKLISAAKKQ